MTKEQIRNTLWGIGCDSFNRMQTFMKISQYLKGGNYWYALRIAHEGSDDTYYLNGLIKEMFKSMEPSRNKLMTKKELKYLDSLPDMITIYRGMTKKELKSKKFGVSWTLKRDVAEFFAFTYCRNYSTRKMKKCVAELTINKSDIIAYFNDREEFEIIYLT